MRVAMFEGYNGPGDATTSNSASVETLIRDQITVLQGVQKTLWDAYGQWRSGRFMIGVVIPASVILQIGRYDYRYSVDSWQSSVDTWWNETMTNAVRANPYEVGSDGKTRIQAWTKMAEGLIEWARQIAREMKDDDVGRIFTDFARSFAYVVQKAINGGVKLTLGILPGWLKWGAVGVGALIILSKVKR